MSFSETRGFAVPRSGGLEGHADGGPGGACALEGGANATGPVDGANMNNVVRNARSMNTNPAVPPGQTGLDPGAWPVVQLYSFGTVAVRYDSGGTQQEVLLDYDEVQGISIGVDRGTYPGGAEVFFEITDMQLNQDPTDEDTWTFAQGAVFYRAFDERGSEAGGSENLRGSLSSIGFADNGFLEVELGGVLEVRTNRHQPVTQLAAGSATYDDIVTVVETSRNSGVFDGTDSSSRSVLGTAASAPRGLAGYLEYDGRVAEVITGSATASFSAGPTLSVGESGDLRPGTRNQVTLHDPDQNLSSDRPDRLSVSDPASIIPTMRIGSPATLASASGAWLVSGGAATPASASVPDRHSERLFVEAPAGSYDGIAVGLGGAAGALLDTSAPGSDGTNWLNYDVGSLADLGGSLGGATISLESGAQQVVLAGPGLERRGLVHLEPAAVSGILGLADPELVVGVPFEVPAGRALQLPLVADLMSFGREGSRDVNNAIYRFELEETSAASSTFEGTIEYAVANQINIFDPGFIGGIAPIDDRVKFVVTGRLADGLFISYSDIDAVGVRTTVSSQPSAGTHTGEVSASPKSLRFGHPVTITVTDPDLNLDNDLTDVYLVVDDPASPIADTVGRDGAVLLEVLLKGVRYERCTIGGVEHGGLGSTGFSLSETGPRTGVFRGSFNMPSWICGPGGTELVSPAGGSLDVRYHDARDSSGEPRTVKLSSRQPPAAPRDVPPSLSAQEVARPPPGETREVVLSGRLGSAVAGVPLEVAVTGPGGASETFESGLAGGAYRSAIVVDSGSPPGTYGVRVSHAGNEVGSLSFEVTAPGIPGWVREGAARWASGTATDAEFAGGLRSLAGSGPEPPPGGPSIPGWVRSGAGWWADGTISDDEFAESVRYLVKKGIIRV